MNFGSNRSARKVTQKRKAPESNTEFDCGGRATDGVRYKSIKEIVDTEFNSEDWYGKSSKYWEKQSASIDGMLGGLGNLDGLDVETSRAFLERILPQNAKKGIALDCGAGIGRVTKHLLLPMFKSVDLLEQNEAYIDKSVVFLRDAHPAHSVDLRICTGMQNFTPDCAGNGVSLVGRYSLIWIQWSIIYLGDDDFVSFMRHCVRCLAPGGVIGVKDNLARSGFLVDKEDSSIMRSDKYYKSLFERARLELFEQQRQNGFPKGLFPVKMYALKPMVDPEG